MLKIKIPSAQHQAYKNTIVFLSNSGLEYEILNAEKLHHVIEVDGSNALRKKFVSLGASHVETIVK